MKYPKCVDWLIFHRIDENQYIVENYLADEEHKKIELSAKDVRFLRSLDGKTNPFAIYSKEDDFEKFKLLCTLSENGLIRYSNYIVKSLFSLVYTVHVFHPTKDSRAVASLVNGLLLVSFLPVLIVGVLLYLSDGDFNDDYLMFGIYFGLVIGLICHEAGHAIAGLANGARVFEAGLFLNYIVMPGAYVLLDERPVQSKLRKVQIYSAGIEMNFLLTGLSLILASAYSNLSGFFLGIAVQNLLLGLLNLVIANPLDGAKIINTLLGTGDFIEFSKKLVLHGKIRNRIWSKGLSGKATAIAAFVITGIQIALPVVLLSNIIGVIIWIKDLF